MKVLDVLKDYDKELFIVLTDDKESVKYRTFSGEWYQYNNHIYFTSLDLIEDQKEIEKAYVDWVIETTNDVIS